MPDEFFGKLIAAAIAFDPNNYLEYTEAEELGFSQLVFNTELTILRKDTYQSLSEEAKYVIRLIMDCPEELEQYAYKSNISRRSVKEYLRSIGWSWKTIWATFRELRQYVNLL